MTGAVVWVKRRYFVEGPDAVDYEDDDDDMFAGDGYVVDAGTEE